VINQMCHGLGHAPRVAGRADSPAFAGEGDQKVMAAGVTAGAGKTMGQDATLKKAPRFALRMRWHLRLPPLVPTPREKGFQVVLHHPIEQCIGGATAAVGSGDASLQLDVHVRVGVRDGIVLIRR
jgi:hypothetical protein